MVVLMYNESKCSEQCNLLQNTKSLLFISEILIVLFKEFCLVAVFICTI